MPLKTKDHYLNQLGKLGHRVFIQGEEVPNVPENPIARPAAVAMAETYEQAQKNPDLFTTKSHLTGEVINRFVHIQQTPDDIVKKVQMLRKMGRNTACCFQRCAGMDAINSVYAITYDIDQEYGTQYHERFVKFLKYIQTNDLVPAACMTDSKGDRSLSPSEQKDKDQYLHVVKEVENGVIVRGAKLHITGGVNSHELLVMPTRALKEEDKDYAIAFSVPIQTKGVTLIYGRQPSDTRRLEKNRSDIGNKFYGGCEALVVFEDVFVPEERIFMKGEYPYAGRLVELFAANHRTSYGGCKVGVGDVLIGAAKAIGEAQGTSNASHFKDKISEMIHLNETLHGVALASAAMGKKTNSGSCVVDQLLANVCKLNVTRFPFEIARLAQDLAGGILVTMPSLEDQNHEEIGEYIKKYMCGKEGIDSDRRMKILRLIENICMGTGAVSYLTESIHGAGSPQAQKIMIERLSNLSESRESALKLCGVKD